MLKISKFTCENKEHGCVTDQAQPCFSYALESDQKRTVVDHAEIKVMKLDPNGKEDSCVWSSPLQTQIAVIYQGQKLLPFASYRAYLTVTDNHGETAKAELTFQTGRMGENWIGQWITDGTYSFTEKKISPTPMTFRKKLKLEKPVKTAQIYATALGIYDLFLDGSRVGERYFAPGFTSYKTHLQYQTYDVTEQIRKAKELMAVVAGGWAVGSFVFTRKNRITADRQALLLELRLEYEDGSKEVIGTDESWEVSMDGPVKMADLYDGETYDARVVPEKMHWRKAALEQVRIHPEILADYGAPVTVERELVPVFLYEKNGELIYDFGQNFAGVVKLRLQGKEGQRIEVHHAEVLNPDGTLNLQFLRTAKATAAYICKEGQQTYSPTMSYMGFRYIAIKGIQKDQVEPTALVLSSQIRKIGEFSCSDERINRLQENIFWSSRSNLMDIPTDCPQRDERMGWTGDIAVFAQTACFNFDMSRFLQKWLLDVKAEQLPTGGIPNTVPVQGYGFPATMPVMALDFWGDACVMVPWAEYLARGDKKILEDFYPVMKKYVKACRFWAGFGIGKHRYIWHTPSVLHFGDWVAADVPKMSQWQKRSKWTATASLCNTSYLTAKIAEILGKTEDAEELHKLSRNTADAYGSVFFEKNGKLTEEFQTGYVLPLYFHMLKGEQEKQAAKHLAELVKKNNYCIGTGFPGTPYILFALADHGYVDVAYKMLLNEKCPSWLYEVKSGATTIWERWDGLDENGNCPITNDGTDMMVSYNHYASGAVGDFLYRRVAGIEPIEAGYRTFRVKPVLDEARSLTQAEASTETPYGSLRSAWTCKNGTFEIHVTVPVGTICELVLPDGTEETLESGTYTRTAVC